MLTGFYNTEILSKTQQKEFMKEAIFLSWQTKVQSKYSEKNNWRGDEPSVSIGEALEICKNLKVVDRTIQHPFIKDDAQTGEISMITTSWKNKGWLLLYCFLNLENLQKLTKAYNLKMK